MAVIQLVQHNRPHNPPNPHSHHLQSPKIMFTDDYPTNIRLMEGYCSTGSANEEGVGMSSANTRMLGFGELGGLCDSVVWVCRYLYQGFPSPRYDDQGRQVHHGCLGWGVVVVSARPTANEQQPSL